MEETWWGVDSDLEEAAFRLRNARLQDRGFPDYYEAQQIYRPLPARDLAERAEPLGRSADDDSQALPQDRSLILPEEGSSFLSQVLHAGFSGEAASELRHELAYLVNRALVAEGVDFADRDRVAETIRAAHDTLNLALESLSGCETSEAIRLLRQHYVQHLFRVAWDILLDLRKSAKRTVEALGMGPPTAEIAFLDTPYREGLAGILGRKPRFYEGIARRGEIRYRPFASLADLEQARTLLADVAALADVCRGLLGQSAAQLAALRPSDADDFRISAALLTGFAHFALGHMPSIEPLGKDDLNELRQATLDPQTGRLRRAVRERFYEAYTLPRGFLDFSLRRFEEDFLAVSGDRPIDPRFVTCLMIRPRRAGSHPQPPPRAP
jgi:hypothetical protein